MSDESFLINTIDTKRISHGSVGGLEKKCLSRFHPQNMEALMMNAWVGDGYQSSFFGRGIEGKEIGDEEHRPSYKL